MTDKKSEDWIFKWKGKEIRTTGDMWDAIKIIKTKKEASDFLEIGSKHQPYLLRDIEYFMGYLSQDMAQKIWDLFKDANMNSWYRLGLYEASKGSDGITPARLTGWIK